MPFTIPEDRKKIDEMNPNLWMNNDLCYGVTVGDRCYYFYKKMVEEFKKERRWTTAHNIYKQMKFDIGSIDYSPNTKCAYELAFKVFFQLHVMPYELEKQTLNGDIK